MNAGGNLPLSFLLLGGPKTTFPLPLQYRYELCTNVHPPQPKADKINLYPPPQKKSGRRGKKPGEVRFQVTLYRCVKKAVAEQKKIDPKNSWPKLSFLLVCNCIIIILFLSACHYESKWFPQKSLAQRRPKNLRRPIFHGPRARDKKFDLWEYLACMFHAVIKRANCVCTERRDITAEAIFCTKRVFIAVEKLLRLSGHTNALRKRQK